MQTLMLLVRRNLRRGRLPLAVIALLAAIASTLSTVGLMCALRYPDLLDDSAARLRAPDVQVFTDAGRRTEVERLLRQDHRVTAVESSPVLSEFATMPMKDSTLNSVVVYLDLDRAARMGRTEVDARRDAQYDNPVYLPVMWRSSGSAALGDAFTVTTGSTTRSFTVAGFFENLYLGTTTMGTMALGLPHDAYAQLASAPGAPTAQVQTQATVEPADEASDVSARIGKTLYRPGDTMLTSRVDNLQLVREALLPGPNTYAASLIAFAVNVVLVVAMIIWFWIGSAIDQDLPSAGVLSTVGVTPGVVRAGICLAPLAAVGAGVLAGAAASLAVVPRVASSLANQSGLEWRPGFDVGASGIVMLAALAFTALLGMLASRRLRALRPVEALAGGVQAHSFRRNWWPLAKSRGPLDLLLGLKTAMAHTGATVMVMATMAVVCLSTIFSTTLTTNVLDNRQAFTRNLIGEVGDITGQSRSGIDRAGLRDEVDRVPGVQRAEWTDYLQGGVAGHQSVFVVMDDFTVQQFSTVHKGREPRHANEVAIGGEVAKQAGVGIGERLTLDFGPRKADYVVVGELSTVQYGGFRVNITTDGYRKLVPGHQLGDLEVFVAPEADVDQVLADVRSVAGDRLVGTQNQRQSIDSQLGVYMTMISQLADGILLLSAVVTVLVLALMTTTLLRRQRASLGVLQSMGHTRRHLLAQVLHAQLPPVLLGAAIGTLAGLVSVPRLITNSLSTMGISRLSVTTSAPLVAGLVGLLVGLALLMTTVVSWPVLRQRPVELLG